MCKFASLVVSQNHAKPLWLEGYTYWLYTRKALDVYARTFDISWLRESIVRIDQGFVRTAYIRDGKLYPAPFGDLRDCPLEQYLQVVRDAVRTAGPVVLMDSIYTIESWTVGLNVHISSKRSVVTIRDGAPEGFDFYSGYDKKYKHWWCELGDLVKPKRVVSLFYKKR